MSGSVEEILSHADELAARFETYDPSEHDETSLNVGNELRKLSQK